VDLTYDAREEAFRQEIRAWLAAHVPREPLPSGDTAEGFARHRRWERQLYEARLSAVAWPAEHGGRGASIWEWLIFEDEYWRAGAPQRVSQNGIFLLAPTLYEFGTGDQKDRFLRRMAAADDLWCQGWSEPGAGSDLAAIRSAAVRDERRGGWRVTGQKAWCTRGAFCDWLFGLFRTDPQAERHRGLTYLLIPLRQPGVTVRAVGRLDGDDGFADVFLDDVFVPDRDVLGKVGEGWNVAMATAGSERGLTLRSPGRFMATAARLLELYRRRPDPEVRDRVIRAYLEAEAYHLYTLRTVTRLADGESIGADASVNKLVWSELDVHLHEAALDLLGPDGLVPHGDGEAWLKGHQFALAGPIYAGTNEIQRNIVAERVLGLPRR
jgi:alkylation response protein AidB-like acyl-CoA dehydrogenase